MFMLRSVPRCRLCLCWRWGCEAASLWMVWSGTLCLSPPISFLATLVNKIIHHKETYRNILADTKQKETCLGTVIWSHKGHLVTSRFQANTEWPQCSPNLMSPSNRSQRDWDRDDCWASSIWDNWPLNWMISPFGVLGSPLRHTSLVSARLTPQLPNRKPICWLPASYGERQRSRDFWHTTTNNHTFTPAVNMLVTINPYFLYDHMRHYI